MDPLRRPVDQRRGGFPVPALDQVVPRSAHQEVGVALIGVLQPEGGPNPRGLMLTAGTMRGIFVGSAAMAKALNAAIDANGIEPLIGRRFGFDQAKEAYAHAWGPDSFAKTVIEL